MSSVRADVCIIGAGVMGSAAAYWLGKEEGLRTILLDRFKVGNDYCSSNDTNRVFRYAYGRDKLYTQMAVESHRLWKQLEQETNERLLVPSELLLLRGDDEESNKFNSESFSTLNELGLGAEELEENELRKRFPQFTATEAVLDPHGGVLLASKTLQTLSSEAKARGVRILENAKVNGIHYDSEAAVQIASGETVECRKVIVTAGPWSNKLRNPRMPQITATRQQLVYFRPPKGLENFRPGTCPVFFADDYYGIPAVGIDGVKMSHKGLWDPADSDTANRSIDVQTVESYRSVCRKFVPELADSFVVNSKVCLYDMTENSDFVIGRDPEHSEAVYGYGFSGHGFKFAPLIGKLMAELALDRQPSFAIERFSPLKRRERGGWREGLPR